MLLKTSEYIKDLERENRKLRKYIRTNAKGDMRFFAERFLESLRRTNKSEADKATGLPKEAR